MYLYLFIIFYYFIIKVKCNICPIYVCGKYNTYNECWVNRLLSFDLCIIQVNNNNKYIEECLNETLNFPYKLNNKFEYNIDGLYYCNNYIKTEINYHPYLDVGKCFYNIINKINTKGYDINGRYINCLELPIEYTPKCNKNICKEYNEYSSCWSLKITEFDYCIMSINKKNKYINQCSDLYGSTFIDYKKNIGNYYENINPYIFKICNNTSHKNVYNIKDYSSYLQVANCFYKIKNKINIYKTINDKNISCLDIEKYYK